MTNIIVSGFPRHRSTIIVNKVAAEFKLTQPENAWAETHKFGENVNDWLTKEDSIYKAWAFNLENYISTLEDHRGNIIFTYSENIPLFAAKLFRSHVTRDWGIESRSKATVSYLEHADSFKQIIPDIKACCDGLVNAMMSKRIVLKSAFVNEDKVGVHIQSSLDPAIAAYLKTTLADYTPPSIYDYISEGKLEFYEQVYTSFGRTL